MIISIDLNVKLKADNDSKAKKKIINLFTSEAGVEKGFDRRTKLNMRKLLRLNKHKFELKHSK